MADRTCDIRVCENQGARLTPGPSQVLSWTDFSSPQTGTLTVQDTAPADKGRDIGKDASFDGQPATPTATGTAFAGATVSLPGIDPLTVQLSTPVNVGVFEAGGTQYLQFFNADGTPADPAALLDGLAARLVAGLAALGPLDPRLTPQVAAILADPVAWLERNAVLTFDLRAGGGVPPLPCFTAGTRIVTRSGERAAETLAVGDDVLTLDHGFQPIRWIGRKALSALDLAAQPDLRPIRIAAGALGEGLPERDLIVSPQHRCLVRSEIARRMTGEREVLAAAKHLLGQPGIEPLPAGAGVVYVHILFDRHELVFSNGAVTESFYPERQDIAALDEAALREIYALFPGLAVGDPNGGPAAARNFLGGHAAQSLVKRSVRNTRQLVQRHRPLRT